MMGVKSFGKTAAVVLFAAVLPVSAAAQPTYYDAVGTFDPYADQRAALNGAAAELRQIEAAGGFVAVPQAATLKLGDTGEAVGLLDQRLRQSGDLLESRLDPLAFDATLEQAVIAFQRRHGLDDDGVVGPRTLAMLNQPVGDLIGRIEINLARLDELPDVTFGRQVVVNLPAFELTAYRDGQAELTMPVIVGREERATPLMVSPITHLVVNPTWTIPPTIMRNDIAPRMMRDPGYLARRGIRVVSGGPAAYGGAFVNWGAVRGGWHAVGLRQGAGPGNPLGRVKFHMENSEMIYLHDTNEPHLFDEARRALSSGCVRVSDPEALAAFVAEGVADDWQGAMQDPRWRTAWVELAEPVPVSLIYQTVWVDEGGLLQVREDIYGHDRQDLVSLPTAATAG